MMIEELKQRFQQLMQDKSLKQQALTWAQENGVISREQLLSENAQERKAAFLKAMQWYAREMLRQEERLEMDLGKKTESYKENIQREFDKFMK